MKRDVQFSVSSLPRVVEWLCLICILVLSFWAAVGRSEASEVECNRYYDAPIKQAAPSGAKPTPSTCRIGLIRGEIVDGDYDKVLSFYRQNHPFLETFLLQSLGGSVNDAIKIGTLFRTYFLQAYAPARIAEFWHLPNFARSGGSFLCEGPSCICASSCALIWLGAPERTGSVGLHRPRTNDPRFAKLPPAAAASAYREILYSITRYLEQMEVPRGLIEAMVSTSSAEISWVDGDRLGKDGLHRAPSFGEWADASCGAFRNSEYKRMIELSATKNQIRKLTPTEEMLFTLLSDKNDAKNSCEGSLFFSNREKLPAP